MKYQIWGVFTILLLFLSQAFQIFFMLFLRSTTKSCLFPNSSFFKVSFVRQQMLESFLKAIIRNKMKSCLVQPGFCFNDSFLMAIFRRQAKSCLGKLIFWFNVGFVVQQNWTVFWWPIFRWKMKRCLAIIGFCSISAFSSNKSLTVPWWPFSEVRCCHISQCLFCS